MPTLNETARTLVRAHLCDDRAQLSAYWTQLAEMLGVAGAEWAIGEVCAYDPELRDPGHDLRKAVIHHLTWLRSDDFYVGGSRT